MTRTHRYLTVAAAILVTCVLSGIAGGFTSLLLDAVGHLTYGYTHGDMLTAVAVGEFVGVAVNHLGGAVSVPTLALIAGAAVVEITQRAPVFAAVFVAELVHPPLEVWVMLLLAAVGAHFVHKAVTRRRAADMTPAEH